ncbi:MAG TPA: hemerythrin domain-containing protein [Bdellovibrionota bacterium]|nr:hemerythrin domain-containing protein [Bdellovibrionota bacterium]
MNIFESLKKDHQDVKALFERISMARGRAAATGKRTFDSLAEMLEVHMLAEEKIFYSELRQHDETRVSAVEALEEHRIGKLLLNELKSGNQASEQWQGKFKAFRSIVEHHIEEEEEEIFEKSEELFENSELEEMGQHFLQEKQRILGAPAKGKAMSSRRSAPARRSKPEAKRRRARAA